MESITIKVEDELAKEIDRAMKPLYSTKTEFIREAIRDKIKDLEKANVMKRILKLYGAGAKKGRKITQADIHKAGEKAFKEIAKELKVNLD